jgi:hypothetical protein
MAYTLAAAAAATGLNKTSILRAIKSGKLSGTKDEFGQWHVEPVELHRVYPAQHCITDTTQRDAVPNAAAIEARAVLAEQRLADLKAMLDEIRTERDAWREQAQRLALPAPAPAMTWWRWLRSTG